MLHTEKENHEKLQHCVF